MKISIAQTKAIKGNISHNIENHKKFIHLAISNGADAIFFPELSLTGYEPELAKSLAIDPNDHILTDFQKISDTDQIIIGIGVPTKNDQGICISMIIFQPNQLREIYSKKYLHQDEAPFFISGKNSIEVIGNIEKIGLAICYELSILEHAENAIQQGASIYVASVAKSADGVEKASLRLAEIAEQYSIPVLMSNAIGFSDNFECYGKSAIWGKKGNLLVHLEAKEGVLIFDTKSREVEKHLIKK